MNRQTNTAERQPSVLDLASALVNGQTVAVVRDVWAFAPNVAASLTLCLHERSQHDSAAYLCRALRERYVEERSKTGPKGGRQLHTEAGQPNADELAESFKNGNVGFVADELWLCTPQAAAAVVSTLAQDYGDEKAAAVLCRALNERFESSATTRRLDAERQAKPDLLYVLTCGSYESFDKLGFEDVLLAVVGVCGCFEDAQALAQRHVQLLLTELHENEEDAAPEAASLLWSREQQTDDAFDDSNGRQREWRAQDSQNSLVFAVTRWAKQGGAS